jgi:hypothetical protein
MNLINDIYRGENDRRDWLLWSFQEART